MEKDYGKNFTSDEWLKEAISHLISIKAKY